MIPHRVVLTPEQREKMPHRVVVVKNEGVKVQKGEAKSTKRRSRRFNGPFQGACLRDVARAAGVTPQKVAEVVQATKALAIEELKTKGMFIVPKFFKAMQR